MSRASTELLIQPTENDGVVSSSDEEIEFQLPAFKTTYRANNVVVQPQTTRSTSPVNVLDKPRVISTSVDSIFSKGVCTNTSFYTVYFLTIHNRTYSVPLQHHVW